MPSGIYKRKPLTNQHKINISLGHKGKKHWNWQGGKTSEAMKIRNSKEYKEWRAKVFERDNYTCQICKERGVYLEAHHIERFADKKDKRLLLENGVTYCRECHAKTKGHQRCLTKLEKEKISKKLLGRKMSLKTRKKMSESRKGKTPWNKGNKKIIEKVICEWCNKKFTPNRNSQRFCSASCSCLRNGNIKKHLKENKKQ